MTAALALAPSAGTGDRQIRLVDLAALSASGAAWDDLLSRALQPHPFFSRHVIEAHRTAGFIAGGLGFVTVWSGERLDAAMPYRVGRDVSALGAPIAQPFLSPYMSSSAPLVAHEDADATLDAFVAGLADASSGRGWRWPLLTSDRGAGAALLGAMQRAGWQAAIVEAFERPMLDRRKSLAAFADDHPRKGRLKDLRRRQRRLAEAGTLRLDTACEGQALARALEAFLYLEASGWKGEAGTAMRSRPRSLALARAMFSDGGGPVSVRADTLMLDERPLAASLALVAGGTASLLKTAFDENERAHAPGLVLEAEIVRALHEERFADRLDSATLAGSALESLYRERETVADIIAVPPGDRLLSLDRRVQLARFEQRARQEAKRVLKRR